MKPDERPGRRLVGDPTVGTAPANTAPALVDRTHIVVATPWAGSWRLGNLMGRTGTMPTPRSWFDPLQAPALARELGVASGTRSWADRYLAAVRERVTEDRVCTFSLMWTHQRFLLQIARIALGSSLDAVAALDPDVVAASFPNPSYVWVRCGDTATQALRWYVSLHPELAAADPSGSSGASAADFQEVRWLESIVIRQERGWATYFAIHRLAPIVVEYEELVAEPETQALAVVRQLGYEPSARPRVRGADDGIDAVAGRLAEPYRRARARASSVVGVRARSA